MPFTSITELYQHTNFRVVVLPNSADEDFFRYSTDPIIQKIYEERIKPFLKDIAQAYRGKITVTLKCHNLIHD